jgi:RHS repeat-associated protein
VPSIFADDFESGGFGYWGASTGVSVTTAASLAPAGTRGMSVPLASATTAKYVTDNAPGVETRYRARFYFDPNSITIANSADHVLFYADSGTTPVLQLDFGYTTAGGYRLRTRLRDNASIWNNSLWVNITDAPHVIEVDWQSATSGSLAWWIDGTAQTPPANINNSNRRIDRARMGAVANVDSTTNGTMYFDAFEARRQTYIGPFPGGLVSTNIVYDYDPLYRLTAADYNGGTTYFHYSYDAVGNRQTEVTQAGTTTYGYDIANRLTSVGGVPYTWDNNGNLQSDGASTLSYDHANRLSTVAQGSNIYSLAYNGLGDRLRQTINAVPTNYTVDLAAGLTQVLMDGTNSYLYGVARIGEEQTGGWQYHLGDALGSVRQLANGGAAATLARSYEPFGDTLTTAGATATAWQFTGEARDGTGLTYLRARYYFSAVGRFATRDSWGGEQLSPASSTIRRLSSTGAADAQSTKSYRAKATARPYLRSGEKFKTSCAEGQKTQEPTRPRFIPPALRGTLRFLSPSLSFGTMVRSSRPELRSRSSTLRANHVASSPWRRSSTLQSATSQRMTSTVRSRAKSYPRSAMG